MIGLIYSPISILTFGAFHLFHPTPVYKPAEAPRTSVRPATERTGREINLARFVFSEEELAQRRAAREGRKSVQSVYHFQKPEEPSAEQQPATKNGRHRERAAVSKAYSYRDKNAWKRNDIDGDGVPNLMDLYPYDPSKF